jgi:glycosyltransferase involved in cell wall biosynthesis
VQIAAYIHVHRTRNPTGVGKHIIHMTSALAAQPDVSLTLLAPRRSLDAQGRIENCPELARLPLTTLPGSWRLIERTWTLLGRPRVERWAPQADWVYAPAETFVPTRRAKLAVTIHCVNWFERELPWHDEPEIRSRRRRLRLAWRPMLRRADRVLVVSAFLGARMSALFHVEPARLAVVGNGVEEAYFAAADQPVDRATLPTDRPYLLVVGGLTQRKGGPRVLAAARRLIERWPDARVLVAGRSEPALEREAASVPNVQHLGYVSSSAGLPRLLRGATAMLFLSRYETFGIPAVEAMATGTTPIVSQHAALPEVVGEGGVVVSDDAEAVCDAVLRLRDDESHRARLAAAGRARAAQFTWAACAARVRAAMG